MSHSASHMPINWQYELALIDELAESSFAAVISGVAVLCLKYAYSEVGHMFSVTCLKLTQGSCSKSK